MNHAYLLETLRPLAALAAGYDASVSDSTVVLSVGENALNVGHLRRAAHAVSSEEYINASGALTDTDAKWQQLAREGRYMEAVKECRARSGLSLMEARSVVERFVGRPLR